LIGKGLGRIPDHRQATSPIPLTDALMSAIAMFSLKDPSLLAFEQRRKALEAFEFYAGCYLLSLDGTGYFSSQKIHCSSCQMKEPN
jgi:hypothetical protein